jgi:flagellar basal body-associated protein FliL
MIAKMKKGIIILAVIIVIVIAAAGYFVTGSNCSDLSSHDLDLKLECSMAAVL